MNKLKSFLKKKFPILTKVKPLLEKTIYGTVLKEFEFHVVDHCNLNCRGCFHFSNLMPSNFIDCRVLEKRLSRINEIFGKIKIVKILGGEPLLHPEIIQILKIARKNIPHSHIVLFTNGLLLKKISDDFLKACEENKIILQISLYPPTQKIIDLLKEKISRYNIRLDLTNPITNFFAILNPSGISDKKESFLKCGSKCTILKEDNIYHCSLSAYIEYYNKKFNKNILCGKGINIFNNSAKKILEYLNSIPEETCSYCTNNIRYIDWENSATPQPEDWNGKQN